MLQVVEHCYFVMILKVGNCRKNGFAACKLRNHEGFGFDKGGSAEMYNLKILNNTSEAVFKNL